MLSEETIQKFKAIYLKVYGESISDKEALQMAGNLLNLYRVLYKSQLNMNISQNYETQIQPPQN